VSVEGDKVTRGQCCDPAHPPCWGDKDSDHFEKKEGRQSRVDFYLSRLLVLLVLVLLASLLLGLPAALLYGLYEFGVKISAGFSSPFDYVCKQLFLILFATGLIGYCCLVLEKWQWARSETEIDAILRRGEDLYDRLIWEWVDCPVCGKQVRLRKANVTGYLFLAAHPEGDIYDPDGECPGSLRYYTETEP